MDQVVRLLIMRIDTTVKEAPLQEKGQSLCNACISVARCLDQLLRLQNKGAQDDAYVFFLNFLHHCYGKFYPANELAFLDRLDRPDLLLRVRKIRLRFANVTPNDVTHHFAKETLDVFKRIHDACHFLLHPEAYAPREKRQQIREVR